MRRVILNIVLLVACFPISNLYAQKLEVTVEKDEMSVSTKVKSDVPSSRLIVSSAIQLNYTTNMSEIDADDIYHGVVNGMYSDTIYFYLTPDDCKRRVSFMAEGYPTETASFVLLAKETYKCLVFDPNTKTTEVALSKKSAEWQFRMAQNFDFGRDDFEQDQNEAVRWYKQAAEQGYSLAQVTLGMKYSTGVQGVAKDISESTKWFLIAAQQGNPIAQYAIANYFMNGYGVEKSSSKAYYWYKEAAKSGVDKSHYRMVDVLLDGYGSTQDVIDQLNWFRDLADKNDAEAQYIYGKLLIERMYSPKNESIGIAYLNNAIALSNDDAMFYLGNRYLDKTKKNHDVVKGVDLLRMADNVGNFYAPYVLEHYDSIFTDEEKFIYTKYFAEHESIDDITALGHMYFNGVGTDQNYTEAYNCYVKATENGDTTVFYELALCYYSGLGTSKNPKKAFENFFKAHELGCIDSKFYLGECYYNGFGTNIDYNKAFEFYSVAAEHNHATAINGKGLCYYNGRGVKKDLTTAFNLFREALKGDIYNAALSLGDYYYYSYNPEADDKTRKNTLNKTKYYYELSAKEGNPKAQNILGVYILNTNKLEANNKGSKEKLLPTSRQQAEALGWFEKSSNNNNLDAIYNYAYSLIAFTNEKLLYGSDMGKTAVEKFKVAANLGHKPSMAALSYFYQYNCINLSDAYHWIEKAAEGENDLYKALLGAFMMQNAKELISILQKPESTIHAIGAQHLLAVENNKDCSFVYPLLLDYYKKIDKDRKKAKVYKSKMKKLSDEELLSPEQPNFIR